VFKRTRDYLVIFGCRFFVVRILMTSSKDDTTVVTIDELADKGADTVDSDIRYMAYGARLRTALRAGTRYVAYVASHPHFRYNKF
jgi:hypothetical protein